MSQQNKLFVGNLSFDFSEDHLRDTLTQVFSKHGTVVKVEIPINRDTGKIKGIAFVTMESDEEAENCKRELDGIELAADENSQNFRAIKIEVARPMVPRPKTFSGGSRGGYSSNGGGYGGSNGGGYNKYSDRN